MRRSGCSSGRPSHRWCSARWPGGRPRRPGDRLACGGGVDGHAPCRNASRRGARRNAARACRRLPRAAAAFHGGPRRRAVRGPDVRSRAPHGAPRRGVGRAARVRRGRRRMAEFRDGRRWTDRGGRRDPVDGRRAVGPGVHPRSRRLGAADRRPRHRAGRMVGHRAAGRRRHRQRGARRRGPHADPALRAERPARPSLRLVRGHRRAHVRPRIARRRPARRGHRHSHGPRGDRRDPSDRCAGQRAGRPPGRCHGHRAAT